MAEWRYFDSESQDCPDRLFDSLKDNTLVNVLVAVDRVDQSEKFGSVHHCSFSACYPQSGHPVLRKHPASSEIRNFRSQESPVMGVYFCGSRPQRCIIVVRKKKNRSLFPSRGTKKCGPVTHTSHRGGRQPSHTTDKHLSRHHGAR